ncbi:hypothetical protein Tco_1542795 [Tanacetum coccineum]
MDDPNITMEEYIKLKEEKARKRRKVFNWETAKYGKIWYDEDIHDLRSVETEFPAIAFTCEPTVSSLNDEIDFRVLFDDSNDEDYTYTEADIADFESRLARIYMREVHRVQVFDFGGLPYLMAEGLSAKMLMEHRDAQGQSVRRISWREFILALGLHTDEEMQTVGFGAYWAEIARQIPNKGDLRDYWIGISSAGDFLGITPILHCDSGSYS